MIFHEIKKYNNFFIGNYLQDIGDFAGWRLAFVIGCVPGFFVAFLLFFVKDPRKETKPDNNLYGESKKSGFSYGSGSGNNSKETGKNTNSKKKRKRSAVIREEKNYFKIVILALIQPAMVLLFVAAAVRHTGENMP